MSITAHCLVKNEEVFIEAVLMSAINFVEKIIIFDTGSTDETVNKIKKLIQKYPTKIIFEEKGECDKKRHTQLRQEMVDNTKTDWFMILDGDEVWPTKTLEEAMSVINSQQNVECIVVPFYLCVGDVYHEYRKAGAIEILGKTNFHYPRFIKKIRGVRWSGDYNSDTLVDSVGKVFFTKDNTLFLKNKFWHLTHLRRSSHDDKDYSSGGLRSDKRRLSYFLVGRVIDNKLPGSLNGFAVELSFAQSLINFIVWSTKRLTKNFGR